MKHIERHEYKAALMNKLADLSHTLTRRNSIAIETAPDICEEMMLASHRELAVITLDRNSRLLREVKAALSRLQTASYGWCELCDEEIPRKRLQAVPWARHCVACQEALDRDPDPAQAATPVRLPIAA